MSEVDGPQRPVRRNYFDNDPWWKRKGPLAGIIVLVLALAAGGWFFATRGTNSDATPTPAPTTTGATTASPQPSTIATSSVTPSQSPASIAARDAAIAFRAYSAAEERVKQNGGMGAEVLNRYMTGQELKNEQKFLADFRATNTKQVGASRILVLRPTGFYPSSEGPISAVRFATCVDNHGVSWHVGATGQTLNVGAAKQRYVSFWAQVEKTNKGWKYSQGGGTKVVPKCSL